MEESIELKLLRKLLKNNQFIRDIVSCTASSYFILSVSCKNCIVANEIVIRETAILPTTMVSSNDEWCTSQDYVSLNTKKKVRKTHNCVYGSK